MTNVLIIIADELSTWGLGCYGGQVHTPNIDRLANQGVRYDAAYTPSPICVPTRACIATGRYLNRIGYWDSANAYDGQVPGWGHACQAAGVPVTSIGKLHYRSADDPTGFDRQIEPIHIPNGIGWVRALLRRPLASFDATAEMAEMIGPGHSDYTRFDERVTEETCRLLTSSDKDTPWVNFVSYVSPHYPLMVPEEFYDLYDAASLESAPDPLPDHPVLHQIATFFDHDRHFTHRTRGIGRAAYFGLCSFLDAQVGKVLAALEASGQAEDTVVLLTSDHGEMLGRRGIWGKSTMYEDAARVPLIMAGPGIAPGTRPDPVSLVDLAPTICGVVGADAGEHDGQDLAHQAPDRTVISEYHDGGSPVGITMVRWSNWKYVHYAEGHPPQLFDLSGDPEETNDLSADRPDILDEARRRMAGMLDAEAVNERAHADQAAMAEKLGGYDKLVAMEQWAFTPADSR